MDQELHRSRGLAHCHRDVLDFHVLLELEHQRCLLLVGQRLDERPDPAHLVTVGGQVVDRVDRRGVLVGTFLSQALCALALGVLSRWGQAKVQYIYIVLALFIVIAGKWRDPRTLSGKAVVFLVLSGLATGASWFCYFRALKLGNAGQVAPVDKMSVVLVAIFGVLFLGEKLSTLNWLGVALITFGAVLVAI